VTGTPPARTSETVALAVDYISARTVARRLRRALMVEVTG